MEQKFKNKDAEQYFKFQDAVMLNIADDMHFMRNNGIFKHSGKIGSNLSYNGCMGIENRGYRFDVLLTKNINSKKTEDLCRVSGWSGSGFDIINVMTRKACLNPRDAEFKMYDGISRFTNSYVGLLNVDYGKGENPDKFLESLFHTIEKSKNDELGANKIKLTKLNFIAKMSHLIMNKNESHEMQR